MSRSICDLRSSWQAMQWTRAIRNTARIARRYEARSLALDGQDRPRRSGRRLRRSEEGLQRVDDRLRDIAARALGAADDLACVRLVFSRVGRDDPARLGAE